MRSLLFSILLSLIALPVFAENQQPWWKIFDFTDEVGESVKTAANINNRDFTKEESSILNDYLRDRVLGKRDTENEYKGKKKHKDKKKKLPPGLRKKVERGGELPPGWQKKVARGEVLDEDLYLASQGLPQDIIDLLPTGPVDTSIRRIDDRVVRVMDATGVILDVLKGGRQQ